MECWPPVYGESLAINELMAANESGLRDENGDASDWFELFNGGAGSLDLSGCGFSDDGQRPFKWILQKGQLAPGGFLVIFASGKDRQPQSSAPQDPRSITGLTVYLSADTVNPRNAAEIRQANGGNYVKAWLDHSGGGISAFQGTSGLQPIWVTNVVNGRPTLRFDGQDDQLLLTRAPATNDFTVIVVARAWLGHEIDPENNAGVGGISGQRYLLGARHGGDWAAGAGLSMGTNGASVYEHGSGYMPALAVARNYLGKTFQIITLRYASRRPDLFIQGQAARQGVVSARATVTAPIEIGSGAYGGFSGDVAELLVYNRPLADAERRGVEQYLAGKYGLVLAQSLHANFKLSAQGETLRVTRPDGTLADRAAFPALPRNVSSGRQPDGAGPFLYFTQPSPGQSNLAAGASEPIGELAFSQAGGFFTNEFRLEIRSGSPGAQIRYTLDGGTPTVASLLYTQALAITSRAGTPNRFSAIPTVPGGQTANGEVFKGWVIKARAFKEGALPSPVVARTYWVSMAGRARYTLPVISLSTDQANLFDSNLGIYVPGNALGGNYSQRGPAWERPVHVEFYETNNALAFAQPASVKIHGNTSQGFPIKGLDLDATGNDGGGPFLYPIFPKRPRRQFGHFLLRPTGHDQPYAFMRDEFMQGLVEDLGVETQASRACVVFINGEYWGLHYLKEKHDAEYLAENCGVPEEQQDFLEGYATARVGDTQGWNEMVQFMQTHSLAEPGNYARAREMLDTDNYIIYKATESFCYRWDMGNHRLWRSRSPGGRWRWVQFDNDVGWGGFWATQPAWEFDMLRRQLVPTGEMDGHSNETTTFLLRHLVESGEFKRQFINGFADLLNSVYVPARALSYIDARAAELLPEISEHIRRWRMPASSVEWRSNVQYLRDYAIRRPAFCRQHLMDHLGAAGTARITLSVSDPNAGSIRLNLLEIRASTNDPWRGAYFSNNPISLTAKPIPGWKFAGWRGISGNASTTLQLPADQALAITALFQPSAMARPVITSWSIGRPGAIQFWLRGNPGQKLVLQTSADLRGWSGQGAILLDDTGSGRYEAAISSTTGGAFFRLMSPGN